MDVLTAPPPKFYKPVDTYPRQVLFEPFPKQAEFIDAALGGEFDFILYGGAIRGGKTYAMLALFLILARIYPGSRSFIVRKDRMVLENNTMPSWDKIKPGKYIKHWDKKTMTCTLKNNSQIIFFPESYEKDKELNRFKGLEANGFGFEELNECQEATLQKAFERAGSYIIPPQLAIDGSGRLIEVRQPKPVVVGTCNPTQGWVKKLMYTPWKEQRLKKNYLYIQSRIYDNEPLLRQQPHYLPNLKRTLNPYQYLVFVEGNWDVQLKTGGEWAAGFELDTHVKSGLKFDPSKICCLSWDNNVLPYVAVSMWQLLKTDAGGWVMRCVMNFPCEEPDNSPRLAAQRVARWLKMQDYELLRIQCFGDRSTKARNNMDEKKRSFFQVMTETLRVEGFIPEDRMYLEGAPSVSNMGDFVNAIFRGEIPGLAIEIAEECTELIGDLIVTKTDKDGGLLKTDKADKPGGPSYQHNGHFTDTLKDFICQCWGEVYKRFIKRNSSFEPEGISVIRRTNNITP